jgi:hypothetical protein
VSTLTSPSIHFAVFAESGRTLAYADATLIADDFSVTSGGPVRIKAGGTATAVLTTQATSGQTDQTIAIQLTDKPTGLAIGGTPPTVKAGESVSIPLVAIASSPSNPSGTLTFLLSNGALTHTVQVPIAVDGATSDVHGGGGCATAPIAALWPLGACVAWLLHPRRTSRRSARR